MNAIKRAMPAIHPGVIIKHEYMDAFNLTQEQLGKLLGLARPNVNRMLNGHLRISAETAVRLAAVFKTSAKFWMNLQAMYDIDQARRDANTAKALAVLHKFFNKEPKLTPDTTVNMGGDTVTVSSFKGIKTNDDRRTNDGLRELVDALAKIDGKPTAGRKKKGE